MSTFDFPSRVDVVNVDWIGDPAFVVDTHGVVVSCNREAAWLFGRPASRIVGRRCYSVVRGCLSSGESACSANCPLIQGLGVLPGPPAVELVVRGGGNPAARWAINVQHIPTNDVHHRPSGLLHIMTLAGPHEGPVDAAVDEVYPAPPANYLG